MALFCWLVGWLVGWLVTTSPASDSGPSRPKARHSVARSQCRAFLPAVQDERRRACEDCFLHQRLDLAVDHLHAFGVNAARPRLHETPSSQQSRLHRCVFGLPRLSHVLPPAPSAHRRPSSLGGTLVHHKFRRNGLFSLSVNIASSSLWPSSFSSTPSSDSSHVSRVVPLVADLIGLSDNLASSAQNVELADHACSSWSPHKHLRCLWCGHFNPRLHTGRKPWRQSHGPPSRGT